MKKGKILPVLACCFLLLACGSDREPQESRSEEADGSYGLVIELAQAELAEIFQDYEGFRIEQTGTAARTDNADRIIVQFTYSSENGSGVYGFEYQKDSQEEPRLVRQGENVTVDLLVQDKDAPGTKEEAAVFTDDLGREVTVPACDRVATLLGSYADMWILAGGEICAAPEDAFDDFDLPLSEETVNLGETKRLSLELLLAADPDFVLASTNTPQHLEWQQALEGAGITVAYFDVACFEDYLRMLKICTDITGQPERYEQYGAELDGQIKEILERNREKEPPSVLVMRASATSIRAKNSSGNVLGEMLESFGCHNIADSDGSLLENLSVESIMLQNPDRIFIVQSGDDTEGTQKNIEAMFQENPLWKELDAVKNGQLYFLDKHLYNLKPNARWAKAYSFSLARKKQRRIFHYEENLFRAHPHDSPAVGAGVYAGIAALHGAGGKLQHHQNG